MQTLERRYRVDPTLPEDEAAAWAIPLAQRGWRRTEEDDWRFWLAGAYPERSFYQALEPGQWVSRLPGIGALAVKRDLCENARWAHHWMGGRDEQRDHPLGFLLPAERNELLRAAAEAPERSWLLKPQASRWGEGISLLSSAEEAPAQGAWLVQEYVAHPHLIDGMKYHLRFYALITSLDPLVFYLHELGTCLFATRTYTLDPRHRDDRFVHLTNVAIQEQSTAGVTQRKWTLERYLARLHDAGEDGGRLIQRIRDAVTRLVIAAREQALLESRESRHDLRTCFDLVSIDVLVDRELRPWVLEFNAGTPLTFAAWRGRRVDGTEVARDAERLRSALLGDLLDLLGFSEGLRIGDGDRDRDWLVRDLRQLSRGGGWHRLWPGQDAARFVDCFPVLRPRDRLLASARCPDVEDEPPTLATHQGVIALPFAEGLVLYESRTRMLHLLDAAGALVWLSLVEGMQPVSIVGELSHLFPDAPRETIASDIWGLVTAWAQRGLLEVGEGGGSQRSSASPPTPTFAADARELSPHLIVPQCLLVQGASGCSLFVALDEGVDTSNSALPSGECYASRELPLEQAVDLVLVQSGRGEEPKVHRGSAARALHALLVAARVRYAPSLEQATDFLRWLESLRCIEVETLAPLLERKALLGAPLLADPSGFECIEPVLEAETGCVRLVAMGDVALGRDLTRRIDRHGHSYPFAKLGELLAGADLRVCNLESPLTKRGAARCKAVVFRGRPEHADALRAVDFDVATVANNHIADYGDEGVRDTLCALASANVASSGARSSSEEPFRAARVLRNGLRIAFLSYNDFVEGSVDEHRLVALADEPTLRREVASEREESDVVIVSLHAGNEFCTRPSARQRELARAAVEAGASLVLGHHPHVLQGLERIGDALIAHSLGNCVFDLHYNPLHITERAFESVMLEVTLTRRGLAAARLLPIVIDVHQDRPRPATSSEAGSILARLRALSECPITRDGRVCFP